MNESAAAGAATTPQFENYYRWVEPDSDITVCLKLEAMDRLQQQVLRANDFRLHAGSEVGGILLGRTECDERGTLIFVEGFEPVPSEYDNGPAYVLGAKDAFNLEAALSRAGAHETLGVVGYYRSHNRGGLFLSSDDLRLIRRYFRGPHNLFLLIKTLANRACTAGFFFWKDGQIQNEFTDSEAPLIPTSLSSDGRSGSSGEAADAVPAVPLAPVSRAREEGTKTAAPVEGRRRDRYRRLLADMALASTIAVLTFGLLMYREKGLAGARTSTARPSVPVAAVPIAADQSLASASGPAGAPPPAVKQPTPIIPTLTKTAAGNERNVHTSPRRSDPAWPDSAPAPQTPARRSFIAAREPSAPTSPKRLTAATEGLLNAPPAPVTLPPISENPVMAMIEAPQPPASPRVVSPVSTPAPLPPAASPAPHTFVGPQVIHQVAPAVPRGVGPMITTDVQIDVAVVIDAGGKVINARIASTKGSAAGLLTIEALKAAQLFRFRPALENGSNVVSSTVLTFRFAQTVK